MSTHPGDNRPEPMTPPAQTRTRVLEHAAKENTVMTTTPTGRAAIVHDEPCGCRYRQTDVPDDVVIGQGWQAVTTCPDHTTPPGPGQPPQTPLPRALLTPAEVAAWFRVDPKTVTRWATAGKLSAIRTPGGHRRYLADQVHALLTPPTGQAAHRPTTPATPPNEPTTRWPASNEPVQVAE